MVPAIEEPRSVMRIEAELKRRPVKELVSFVCFITFSWLVFVIRILLFMLLFQTLGFFEVIRFLFLGQFLPFQAQFSTDVKVVHLRIFVGNDPPPLLGPKDKGV